jgi:nitroimidazol reductase NimA-like FMN-containing flavoprotein (pyridoxamine 5'-phosphate oxidase superfamily)
LTVETSRRRNATVGYVARMVQNTTRSPTDPPSDRTRVRRGANRAVYDVEHVRSILDAGVVAHVGVTTDDGPIVLPMAYGVRPSQDGGEDVLVHGALANALLGASRSVDVCLTVTIVDGLVVARTPFHNSMNYRSVVVRGTATAIEDADEKLAALRVINDHLAPIWDTARPPSVGDVKKTLVLAIPLVEASAKVRDGDPVDEDDDLDGPHWAGIVPLRTTWGAPYAAADLRGDASVPDGVRMLDGRDAHAPRS